MGIFNDTITVYNHLPNDMYQRTVVRGVQYSRNTGKTVTGDGKVNLATTVDITIPVTAKADRKYLDKQQFQQMENSSEYWTLDDAGNLDVIVYDECSQEITDDYRLKHLKSDYGAVTVSAVKDNRNRPRLKHVRVVCK